jgi:hypothetical protein
MIDGRWQMIDGRWQMADESEVLYHYLNVVPLAVHQG